MNNTGKIITLAGAFLAFLIGSGAAVEAGTLAVTKAGSNWFYSGASNGGFCILWLPGFTAALGIEGRLRHTHEG